MHDRYNNHDIVALNVYDYSGHIIYSEEIATNGNDEQDIDFRATIDDKFIDQKIAEFEAKKGGDGK